MQANSLRLLAGALSGWLWAACYPPLELSALAWVALIPLFVALRGTRAGLAFAIGVAAWCTFWPSYLGWALGLDGIGLRNWGAAIVATSGAFGVLGVLLARLAGSARQLGPLGVAAAWVAGEKLRLGLGFAAVPWGLVGESQHAFLALLQLAALTGTLGISFLVVWVNAALADAIVLRRGPRPAPLLVVLAVALAGAVALAREPARPTLRVALVQAGVYTRGLDAQEERLAVWERYLRLSREVSREHPELIVWPSSSVPTQIPADVLAARELGALARESGAFLLVGSAGQEKRRPGVRERPVANSAFLVSPAGSFAGRYDKIRLLPFNEYVPLRGRLRWPRWIAADIVDARAGTERTVFTAGRAHFAVLICWESFFPDHFRASAGRGVDFVVSMTNEAFTASDAAHRQMHAINVLRAVENGVSVVRPATTGLSSVIGPDGRVLARVEDEDGRATDSIATSVAEVPLAAERTLYTRVGDWFVYLVAFPILGAAGVRGGAWRRARPA